MSDLIDSYSLMPILAQGEGGPMGGGSFIIIFYVLLFAGLWFLLLAPQRKKQKQHEKLISELGTGDRVVTNGGIFGEITNVKTDRFVVRIAENTKVEITKSAVQSKVANQ